MTLLLKSVQSKSFHKQHNLYQKIVKTTKFPKSTLSNFRRFPKFSMRFQKDWVENRYEK